MLLRIIALHLAAADATPQHGERGGHHGRRQLEHRYPTRLRGGGYSCCTLDGGIRYLEAVGSIHNMLADWEASS